MTVMTTTPKHDARSTDAPRIESASDELGADVPDPVAEGELEAIVGEGAAALTPFSARAEDESAAKPTERGEERYTE